jgi:hypothetical protein
LNQKYCREHVNRSLTEQRVLLSSALNAVIEALRMNPDKYVVIYNNHDDDNNIG